MKADLYLKSGQRVRVDVDELTVEHTGLSKFSGLQWTTPATGRDRLMQIRIEEIDAVVVRRGLWQRLKARRPLRWLF